MKLKTLAVAFALCFGSLVGVSAMATAAYAASGDSKSCPEGSLNDTYEASLAECNMPKSEPGTEKGLMERVVDIINAIVGVVSILAVIVVVIGGILFVTSTGDAAKTTRARNTILYGMVGLIISLLAFAIVSFVTQVVFKPGSSDGENKDATTSEEEVDK